MESSGVTQGSPEDVDRSKRAESLSDGLATCGDRFGWGSPHPSPHENCYLVGGSERAFMSFLSNQFHFTDI